MKITFPSVCPAFKGCSRGDKLDVTRLNYDQLENLLVSTHCFVFNGVLRDSITSGFSFYTKTSVTYSNHVLNNKMYGGYKHFRSSLL